MLRRTLFAALLVTALLAGCGGDDAPQTKEGFINDADRVCENLAEELADAGARQPGTPKEVADANDVLADLYGRLSDDLADVRLPDGGAARREAQAFVASVRRADPLLDRLRATSARFLDAARDNDAEALRAAGTEVRTTLDAFRAARAESDRRAVELGLNVCGNLG